MAFLCISLNNSSVNTIHILDGELLDIDKYTINFNNAKEILKKYPEKIEELKDRFNLDSNLSDIKVRIFLANDKEQFVMYNKHFLAFKYLVQRIDFLKYAVENDSKLFNKELRTIINETSGPINSNIKSYLQTLNEEDMYSLIRKLCEQYDNYIEDNGTTNNPSIEQIAKSNLGNITIETPPKKEQTTEVKNPFAVFEHPKFFKVYGSTIDKSKKVFILGNDNSNTDIYKELYASCKKCFTNEIYCPLNYELLKPIDNDMASLFDNALIAVVYSTNTDNELVKKINYLYSKNVTILILSDNDKLIQAYNTFYKNNTDNIIIKKYISNNYDSLKMFSDIMAGFYINNYKNSKESK